MNLLGVALALMLTVKDGGKPKVAVTDLTDVTGQDAGKAKLLSQVVVSEVSQLRRFSVIDAAGIAEVLGLERQRQLLGCNESNCLAELGGAMGVDYLLAGSVGRLGKKYRLDVKLVDAKRGVTLASEGQFVEGGEDQLGAATSAVVRSLFRQAKLVDALDALPPAGAVSGPSPEAAAEPTRVPAYLLLGGGAVLAVVAGVFTAKASKDYTTLQQLSTGGDANAFSAQQSTVRRDDVAADLLWVGAAAAVGTGVYFFFSPPGGAESPPEVGVGGHF